jgi:hypothetical protein
VYDPVVVQVFDSAKKLVHEVAVMVLIENLAKAPVNAVFKTELHGNNEL